MITIVLRNYKSGQRINFGIIKIAEASKRLQLYHQRNSIRNIVQSKTYRMDNNDFDIIEQLLLLELAAS